MDRLSTSLPTILLMLIIAAGSANAGINDSDWPMPYHDIRHTSYSNATSILNISKIAVLKTFNASGDINTPSAADLNCDGKAEIVFSTRNNRLYALDSDFRIMWTKNLSCKPTAPAIFDLQNDGILEILYGCSDGKLNVLDSNGTLLWSYQTNGSIDATPTAGNLDYTRELEIVFASTDKNLYVLDSKGNNLRDYSLPDSSFSSAAIGDIDADKSNEIIIGSQDSKAYIISYAKGSIWLYDTEGSVSSPVLVTLKRTKYPRIGLGTGDGHICSIYYMEYTKGTELKCSVSDCILVPITVSKLTANWDFFGGEGVMHSPAVADLNNDSEMEYVSGTSGKNLYIMDTLGNILKKHSVNGKITSTPAIADFDGDKKPEIVFGSSDGVVQILNNNGSRIWEFRSGQLISDSPAIADLERDNKLEILIPAANKLYMLGEGKPVNKTTPPKNITRTNSTNMTAGNITNSTTNGNKTNISSATTTPTTTTSTSTTSTTIEVTTTSIAGTATTLPIVINSSTGNETNSTSLNAENKIFSLPLYTVIIIFVGLFFLLQVFLLLVIYLMPSIIQRRIERIRTEIKTYRKDLTTLEKIDKK